VSNQKEKLDALVTLFEQAEQKIKTTEQITGEGIFIPSINELRYTGYHIVRSLQKEDDSSEEINKATNHAKRAIYDIDEALLTYYLLKIQEFKERYKRSTSITEVVPDYSKKLVTINESNMAIQELRKNKHSYQNRELLYKEYEPHIDKLKEIFIELEVSTEEINKKDEGKKRTLFLIILGILVTITIGIANLI
jgi:hypothetical protein